MSLKLTKKVVTSQYILLEWKFQGFWRPNPKELDPNGIPKIMWYDHEDAISRLVQ